MRRRRRRRKKRGILPAVVALLAVAGISWWMYPRDRAEGEIAAPVLAAKSAEPFGAIPPAPTPIPSSPVPDPHRSEDTGTPLTAVNTTAPPAESPLSGATVSTSALVEAGKQAMARNDQVAARKSFNDALAQGLEKNTEAQVRAELARLGTETVFSGRLLPGDPLVDRYVIRTGDSLAKIANQHAVTADLLASLNGITDKNRIREGQAIKVIRGPLHAVVHKRDYRLDVYVGDVLVRSFAVGLGMDDSTPRGEWRVKNKLENPTYYPPRGGAIVSADDPANPLGERWIGLEGISGEAQSQERYGVHGTSEPDSIGKSVSMGCVRLHNTDVESLYTYLVEGRSTVTIVE